MSEKTEKATDYKLKRAREQGQVNQSADLNTCIFMIVMFLIFSALWLEVFSDITNLFRHLFYLINHMVFSTSSIFNLQKFLSFKVLIMWSPVALAGVLCVCLSSVSQTGFIWTAKTIKPDFKRLSLIKGCKKIFSSKAFFDAIKNLFKISFFLLFIFFYLRKNLIDISLISTKQPSTLKNIFAGHFSYVIPVSLIVLLAFSYTDKLFVRWKYLKSQRMTKQEIKDEYKQREGDPKIKAKIKQFQQKIRLKTASINQIKTADVVITNPTHLAVALKYNRELMNAPKVVSKASGFMVKHVKFMAKKYQIPLVENKTFARALFSDVEINQYIDHKHFPVAAMIFSEIYKNQRIS